MRAALECMNGGGVADDEQSRHQVCRLIDSMRFCQAPCNLSFVFRSLVAEYPEYPRRGGVCRCVRLACLALTQWLHGLAAAISRALAWLRQRVLFDVAGRLACAGVPRRFIVLLLVLLRPVPTQMSKC